LINKNKAKTRKSMKSEQLPFVIAQLSDSHLFANVNERHHCADVYQNLLMVLQALKANTTIDMIIFTGDLSQDHSEQSYQNFVEAVHRAKISVPFYYLAGNHDELQLLDQYLATTPFIQQKSTCQHNWQIILLNSKSDTPAGIIEQHELQWLKNEINPDKHQLLMMHHHPIDVGYFIDRHGLENSKDFWQVVDQQPSIKGIACGHVHRALTLHTSPNKSSKSKSSAPLYTCPATSIQFDPTKETVSSTGESAGYRLFSLLDDGKIETDFYYV
jgi:Icc protein